MAKLLKRSLCASLIAAAGLSGLCAQNSANTPVFNWGGDFRVRFEAYQGPLTLTSDVSNSDRDYFRVRLRLWETTNPAPGLTLYGRLAAEPRYWFNNSSKASEGKEWKYGLFDSLYAKWSTEAAEMPVTLIAGRQDIKIGDGWLVSDGTPLDGSWTNYVDGLFVTLDAKQLNTKFEIIALNQQAKPGDRLPILGAKRTYALTEQDETGVIVYASNKLAADTRLDGYFIYKGDDKVTSAGANADIYTVGGKISGTSGEKWKFALEGAYQWGRRDLLVRQPVVISGSREVSAFGFNGGATYSFKDTYKNQVSFFAEYLSGDESGTTGTDEMFDILWGRTPRLGETWAPAYSIETGGRTSQYNNLLRVGASWSISPDKNTSITSTYSLMFAPESSPTRATNINRFGGGQFRGYSLQVVAKRKFSSHLAGLIVAEAAVRGNYYDSQDLMTFLRCELLTTF